MSSSDPMNYDYFESLSFFSDVYQLHQELQVGATTFLAAHRKSYWIWQQK